MEWPSSRIDRWATCLVLAGVGSFAVPDRYTEHQMILAVSCWIIAGLVFIYGFPAVQGKLRLVSREERQRREGVRREFAALAPAEKFALWMYLENVHEKESRVREELQRRGMEVPNYELFEALRSKTGFMKLGVGGPEGVRPEYRSIVRELLSRDPVVGKRTVKRWPSLFVGLAVGIAGVIWWESSWNWRGQAPQEQPPSFSSGPCAVVMSENARLQLIHFFRSIPKRTVHISFALEKPGSGSSCRYAQDLWEVLDTAGWAPLAVQEATRLEGRGVWFGAPKQDDAAEDFYKILSDSNDVHMDRGLYNKDHPQDWYIWIRNLWPEWIQHSLLR